MLLPSSRTSRELIYLFTNFVRNPYSCRPGSGRKQSTVVLCFRAGYRDVHLLLTLTSSSLPPGSGKECEVIDHFALRAPTLHAHVDAPRRPEKLNGPELTSIFNFYKVPD